jgi:hypothetical protein
MYYRPHAAKSQNSEKRGQVYFFDLLRKRLSAMLYEENTLK